MKIGDRISVWNYENMKLKKSVTHVHGTPVRPPFGANSMFRLVGYLIIKKIK